MFKFIIMVIVGLAIWGGLSGAFNFKNSNGSLSVNIDKSKVIESFENGVDKAKNVIDS